MYNNMHNNIYDNEYSIFNRRKKNCKVPQSNQLASAIGSVISSVILTVIFFNLFFSLGFVDFLIGDYFSNYLLVFITAIGYNVFSNLVKSILIIICYSQKKDYTEEIKYQILYSKFEIFAGIAIILVMIFAVVSMFMNNVHTYYLNSWAMFIPYAIIGILGITRIIKAISRIKLLSNMKESLNAEENQYSYSANANTYNNIPYNSPTDSIPQNNYNHTYNTQSQTNNTKKFCTECGMRLAPFENECPVCNTKVKR